MASSTWTGIHLMLKDEQGAEQLIAEAGKLALIGIDTIIVELNYHFEFQSEPDLRAPTFVTQSTAKRLARTLRTHGIRPIPMFNCLGHQSWAEETFVLLTQHPEFDETPGAYPANEGIYCREWCPLHPDVHGIVFPLIDELADAFEADAFHVGMDEVFLIGSELCVRCRGRDPAELFAGEVKLLSDHLQRRGVETLMWADRLLNSASTGYGSWEAAANGTDPAVDMIPKDIILCDWHYEMRDQYPSIELLLAKGFRVWPAGWKDEQATQALITAARQHNHPRMLGHLCTTWGTVAPGDLIDFPPVRVATRRSAAAALAEGNAI